MSRRRARSEACSSHCTAPRQSLSGEAAAACNAVRDQQSRYAILKFDDAKALVVESTGGINGDHSSAEAEFGAFLGNLANECRLVVYNFQYINTNVNPAMPQQKSIAFTL